jgi:hypothetical protein
MNVRLNLFVLANLGITLGYMFLAIFVIPRISVRLTRTKVGGMLFFITCGLHHLDNVFHVLFQPHEEVRNIMLQLHMLLIDVPQVIAVWLFVSGLYVELVRWGPWATIPPAE